MHVLFSCTTLSEELILTSQRDIIINLHVSLRNSRCLSDFSRMIFEKSLSIKFHESPSSVPRGETEGRADRQIWRQ